MTRINVALQPPDDVTARLTRLAEDLLPAADAVFRTGDQGSIPHLTLYMGEFEPADVPVVLKRISSVPSSTVVISCDAQGITCTAGGYLEIAYAKTGALTRAQATVAGTVRDLAQPVAMPRHVTPTQDQQRNLEAYRYELVGDSFRPHVTLGRLATDAGVLLGDRPWSTLSFAPKGLVVAEADEHGAAKRVLMCTDLVGRP